MARSILILPNSWQGLGDIDVTYIVLDTIALQDAHNTQTKHQNTLFNCPRFQRIRNDLENYLADRIIVENFVDNMLVSEDN